MFQFILLIKNVWVFISSILMVSVISYWVWLVMALGLQYAAFIFTTILKPLLGQIRSLGNRLLLYIDDALNEYQSLADCKSQVVSMFSFFESTS